MIKNIKRKVKDIFREKQYSNSAYELKYWEKTGIKKGNSFYQDYLQKFSFDLNTVKSDLVIADFGCGPFGGMCTLFPTNKTYPIDILAKQYNNFDDFEKPYIFGFDGRVCEELADHSIDCLFCCNAIDHTDFPEYIVAEIYRLLKVGGKIFLHVHLRTEDEVNKGHPIAWNEQLFETLFKEYFTIMDYFVDESDEVNGNKHRTLYAQMIKK
jgi:SAM-dependent methyltransferase